ncbi:bifunctional diaminohydroxyphosphoribosylaminopyrimidine deaminase/5-amino-6-(5-phosphoribosylamino)uracil reductase RibD [Thermococcus bergensis]|uniref:bifunctional diaminohydroxyphosphoribosylaminopyrimidine deaminase/5-amino-6-(5-phosphoribosylamino)uracil reductase RibD n=1 Tax=Thermococcus bergensis TaxID=2689387 RepID=UPI001CECD99A|nr:bifunctional diaminohydroxyphosphoribosylaminopyrimidine deaminase/5-amino-6-(5-phosphoribosylamino)uracil reductase RibD [Thermococcus bergensis]MCA6213468.1 bifunctional diaminohydroxyphosphoribosylaminopyrimidine deaminase/5-amino-6-(5-phosphoribosylamino)uracil reductase RibD [Thermococcus bergensis]
MNDEHFMRLALKLSKKGEGRANPNPMVGAVIVKEDKIIGKGYHKRFGDRHAEVNAIEDAKSKGYSLEGATMYVTLEPCSHWGNQPPCVDRIIKEGFSRVVIAMGDPNPLVNGKGVEKLKKAGIKVKVGVLEEEARKLNEVFLKYITTKTPFVAIKLALTLDGFIATNSFSSKWITGEKAREKVQELRKKYMAVMVGANTILKDDPKLTCRIEGCAEKVKVILDRHGLTANGNFRAFEKGRVIIFTESKKEWKNAEVIRETKPERILKILGEKGIDSVLIEGGRIACQFLPFANKLHLFYGNKLFGKGISPFECLNVDKVSDAFKVEFLKFESFGDSFYVEVKPCSQG